MEVERNPEPPKLTPELIDLLTQLCFRQDDPIEKVDGVFVFASMTNISKCAEVVEESIIKGRPKYVFITGGVAPKEVIEEVGAKVYATEADMLLDTFDLARFPELKVFVERDSWNTLDNVRETLRFPEFKECKSLIFVFKSHPAGRGYLTLRKFLPNTKLIQRTFNTKYEKSSEEINRDNWHTFDFGRQRVWGEFLRIQKYGQRGDIEYEEVKDLVEQIEKLVLPE